jgi:hypothetical protein
VDGKATQISKQETPMSDPQYVVVKWADAHSGPGHWGELDEDMGEHIVVTCGIHITEQDGGKPGHLTVAQSQTPDDFYDHVIYIPTGMMRSIEFLKPFTTPLGLDQ